MIVPGPSVFMKILAILAFSLAVLLPARAADSPAKSTSRSAGAQIGRNGPKPGQPAPDFELKSVEGKTLKGSALWSQNPTVLMTASHTCPVFRGKVSGFEGLVKEFGERVNFVVLYTIEAHPKGDPSPYSGKEWTTSANEQIGLLIPQPKTVEERLARAKTCVADTHVSVPVVVDTMDNATWKAYGSAPNCGYLIGRDGKIVAAQPWIQPGEMRSAIVKLLEVQPK